MDPMTMEDRNTQRKLKVLRYAEKISDVAKACRYFGLGRSSFYRWKAELRISAKFGLVNARPSNIGACYTAKSPPKYQPKMRHALR
jgi:hypothetical protein